MSGHSKWATTKRQKAVTDAKRAHAFTRVANMITIAAREKGGNPDTNFSLRLAVEKARDANMPKDSIDRAIKRGTGELAGNTLEEASYEGFGPGGVALVINVLTDNKNRTAADIKRLLAQHGGTFGAQNSVRWMFDAAGVIDLACYTLSEEQELGLIEAGAESIAPHETGITVVTKPDTLQNVKHAADAYGLPITSAEYMLLPKIPMTVDGHARGLLEKLFDALEEHPNITNYYSSLA